MAHKTTGLLHTSLTHDFSKDELLENGTNHRKEMSICGETVFVQNLAYTQSV